MFYSQISHSMLGHANPKVHCSNHDLFSLYSPIYSRSYLAASEVAMEMQCLYISQYEKDMLNYLISHEAFNFNTWRCWYLRKEIPTHSTILCLKFLSGSTNNCSFKMTVGNTDEDGKGNPPLVNEALDYPSLILLNSGGHSHWKVIGGCAALKTPCFFRPFFSSGDPPFQALFQFWRPHFRFFWKILHF